MRSRRITIRHPRKKEPILWIVDSEQWPRACLRAELIERGYDAYGCISAADALDWLTRGRSPKPAALILELRGQNLSAELIQAIHDLNVPTILLGGHPELDEPVIKQYGWHTILSRPFSLGNVADLVEQIVPVTRPNGAETLLL